jgi:acyl-CoA synthetase (AMP-forming)/AMP-acid ligase II
VVVHQSDERSGTRLVATVVRRNGTHVNADARRSHCSERLPGYMVPEHFDVVDALPRTSTGKADRKSLTQQWEKRTSA